MIRDDDDVRVAVTVLVLVAVAVLVIVGIAALGGCVSADLAARVATLEATVQTVQGDVSGIKTQIGGDGDSIVSWIMAGGYVVVILGGIAGALIYPVLVRPIRLKLAANKARPPSQ